MNTKLHTILYIFLAIFSINLSAQNGLDFDGTDDRVDCGNDTSIQLSGKAITLEAWIYPTAWKTNVYEGNVINKENNTNNYGFMLRVGAGGKLNFAMGNGAWTELTSANTILSLNQWQHIAATYDGLKMRIYLNGKITDSLSTTISLSNTTTNLALGYNATYGRYYQGMLDEVRIWNICRSVADISKDMSREYCNTQSNLKAYYKFNQGKAGGSNTNVKLLTDYSGFKNNGTLVSFGLNGSGSNWLTAQSFSRTTSTRYDTATVCDSYNSPSGKYKWTKTGSYSDTLNAYFGCDSVIIVNLTVKKSSTKFITAFACSSYKSPSGLYTWTKNGTYKDYLKNYLNCDSVLTIQLKIGNSKDSINPVVCNSYKSPKGKTYTSSGLYIDTILNYRGCDSIIKINLTVKKTGFSALNAKTCKIYYSPSGKYIYNKTGIYKDTIKNYVNCDSIITIYLNVISTNGTASIKSCKPVKSPSNKYTWTQSGSYKDTIYNYQGCDSLLIINVTILKSSTNSIAISSCKSYRGPGKKRLWKVSGIYKDTLINAAGCDSFLTINLTIHNPNKNVTLSGQTLTAASLTGTYLWLNCAQAMNAVPGETSRIFKPKNSGSYAVEITDSGCVDTSDCVSVNVVGINALKSSNEFKIIPHPNNGNFLIQLPYSNTEIKIIIRDISGRMVYEQNFVNTATCTIHPNTTFHSGIYLLEVITEMSKTSRKIIIEP